MIDEFLQDQAVLYVTGAMSSMERENFELVLEFHLELREFVTGMAEVGAAVILATNAPFISRPSPELKARVTALVCARPQNSVPEGLVMSGPDGLVQWINSAFSAMCGYTLEELQGKKLGPILQGSETDLDTAKRMRVALHEYRPCKETILNYHKNGIPYWVDLSITPIFDQKGQPLWLIARERELKGPLAA